ncbi:MAG TPA: zf-HC2 domain-containing protein [Gemmatimonadaceae bacterium]
MSESTMTCETFGQRLMDFLEGDLDGATHAAMEAHARQCTPCGTLLADFRQLTARASQLPALTPSRDLWSGISARLEAPVVPLAARQPSWRSPYLIGVGIAATFVLAATLGYWTTHHDIPMASAPASTVTSQLAQRASSSPASGIEPAPAPASVGAPSVTDSVQARFAARRAADATPNAVEQTYDTEIAGLRTIVDSRRSHLDSATVAVIEKNLVVIDSAIAQCKSALTKDPASRFLMQSLSQSLDTKVQLLRTAAALPSST